jgi:hypothetical protein
MAAELHALSFKKYYPVCRMAMLEPGCRSGCSCAGRAGAVLCQANDKRLSESCSESSSVALLISFGGRFSCHSKIPLVLDASGSGLNAKIVPTPFSYPLRHNAEEMILPGCFMGKTDLEAYFQQLPLPPVSS